MVCFCKMFIFTNLHVSRHSISFFFYHTFTLCCMSGQPQKSAYWWCLPPYAGTHEQVHGARHKQTNTHTHSDFPFHKFLWIHSSLQCFSSQSEFTSCVRNKGSELKASSPVPPLSARFVLVWCHEKLKSVGALLSDSLTESNHLHTIWWYRNTYKQTHSPSLGC